MYDLTKDPGEAKNVIHDPAYAVQREALRLDLQHFFQRVGAPPIEAWRTTTQQKLPWESRLKGPVFDRNTAQHEQL